MGIVLEPRCPRNVDGISIDPEPNWNFHSLVSAIESVEKKLNAFSKFPQPITNSTSRMGRSGGGFVMHVSEDEMESDEDEDEESEAEEEDKDYSQICTVGRRFAFDEIYLSDESDDEFDNEPEYMMNKMGLAESALYDVNNNHQTEIKDDIRNQVTVVEMEIMNEVETSRSALARVEKYSETRKEVERKLDLQYQRKVAEALDTHLTAVQREHKIKSQIEERKIRSEEEARRRERAHQEERTRQEKARVEAEMLAKSRAEEAKKEFERKAAKEVAEKEEADRKAAEQKLAEEKAVIERLSVAGSSASSNAQAGGKSIQAAESALTLEKHRLKKLEELGAINQSLKSSSNKDFSSFEKHIARVIKQITVVKDNVSAKINEIVKIFKDPSCPVSISIAIFAKKMVSSGQNPFACSYVIVYVTSQFPQAMDILLAEFHKACIYTVPKHIVNSQTAWDSEAYERLSSIMRLYGALVQTDIRGGNATNIHGIEHGWAWLARFLNNISANNRVTATALNAFLQTAGFGLHQRYKSQFVKVVNVVREHFLQRLRAKKDTKDLQLIIAEIMAYLDDRMYLKEPEGRTMKASLLSTEITAELDHPQNNNQYYQRNNYRDNYY
ncbi:PREDICTED: protein GLE1 [Camelina sativa]|uniref:mRNA export factor GLE1 n=1 Tax=Camelina sativa TaxID=90675 RepID=A0ABM0Y3S0_CAMSA|nr:PREDICTED: protein GLE1 [Camelina sativa]XP_010494983.1 PREDICTED: protein GLE1 [Camelina sativa]